MRRAWPGTHGVLPTIPTSLSQCRILESVKAQVGWLRAIGFEQADVSFKWLELAVFGGQKPLGA